jgi:hypothetical protein
MKRHPITLHQGLMDILPSYSQNLHFLLSPSVIANDRAHHDALSHSVSAREGEKSPSLSQNLHFLPFDALIDDCTLQEYFL